MTTSETVTASCLCRGVEWEARKPFASMSHCHCSMCRKTHGAAFGTYVSAAADSFKLRGEANIVTYKSSDLNVRPFCGICGAVVPGTVTDDRAWMPAGSFDDDPGARPSAHIFVASKAPWYELPNDGLRRFDAYPPKYNLPDIPTAREEASEPGWVRGTCLCSAVAYEIEAGGHRVFQCHCSRCRKARAAAHCSNLPVPNTRFRWLRGEDSVHVYKLPNALRFAHAFCTRCGSGVPRAAGEWVIVQAGSLDADPGVVERQHIFVGSKAPWFSIADSLPQHAAQPPR